MNKNSVLAMLMLVAVAAGSFAFAAEAPAPAEKKAPIGYRDTPLLPGGKWHVHDIDRPRPPVVTPAEQVGQAPSDAVRIFDGKDLSQWTDLKGQPSKWRVVDGAMECVPKAGYIQTRDKFGDCQLHLEFCLPTPPKGNSQERGNSGVFFGAGNYEVQVLDSYDNVTYADGQCGALYGQHPPQVNASRKPGEWQTYDIVFRNPVFGPDGKVVRPAYVTVFQNGILMQEHTRLFGATGHKRFPVYKAHEPRSAIQLQDHGNPVRYRNIWLRELKPLEGE